MGEDLSKPQNLKPIKGAKIDIRVLNIVEGRNTSPNPEFFPDENIQGVVILSLTKPFKAHSLSVGLCGVQEFVNLEDDLRQTSLVYHSRETLANFDEQSPPVGQELSFPFLIKVPGSQDLKKPSFCYRLKSVKFSILHSLFAQLEPVD